MKSMAACILVPFVCTAAQGGEPAKKTGPAEWKRLGVPGVVVDHSPASSGLYIGSPSLAVLPGGDYVAAHDFFGPKSNEFKSARSVVFRSADRGRTWKQVGEIQGAFWSSLFVHRGKLYLLGTDRHHGDVVIRRSEDGGATWTQPKDAATGLLRGGGEHHCAPMPVLEHKGRLWRAFEWRNPPVAWGINYRSGMLSAPVDADLLRADSWSATNFLPSDRGWNGKDMGAWLEGNAVVGPDGALVNLLRVQTRSPDEKAAIVRIGPDGKTASFDPEKDFIPFPGGAKKFTVRYDPQTKRYWSVPTIVHPRHRKPNPGGIRNTLALSSSPNLRDWTVHCILLYHPDVKKHGFQYVDWLFEGNDLIAVCRTAYDDGLGGARNNHDANFLTFHRIKNFRTLTMKDSVPAALDPAPKEGADAGCEEADGPADGPEARLRKAGLVLPPVAKPRNTYVPAVRVGNLLFVSGTGPGQADGKPIVGVLGKTMKVPEGKAAARRVGLNVLAIVRQELGSLDRVERLVKTLGMVNAAPDFTEHPAVVNGFSDLMAEVFGAEKGIGTRSAVGMASLPGGIPVEIEAIFQVKD